MPSSCAVSTVQVKPFFDEAAPLSGEQMMAANPYRPWPARITSIIDLTETEKLFEFRLIDERIRDAFSHEPGQFVEVSIFGVGEAPISISSSPSKRGFIELCVRRTGHFTEVLHKMQCGDIVGLRGPFGRGFPFEDMKGHDILLVAGGLGIAPLRSLINNIHDERSEFGKVTIIYGSKNPSEVPSQGLRPVPDGGSSRRHVGRRGRPGHKAFRAFGDRCRQHVRRPVRAAGDV